MVLASIWVRFFETSAAATDLAALWLLHSTFVLALGLLAGWSLRSRGSVLQSAVYRVTLAAALACPLAAWSLARLELSWAYFPLPNAREMLINEQVVTRSVPTVESAPSASTPPNVAPQVVANFAESDRRETAEADDNLAAESARGAGPWRPSLAGTVAPSAETAPSERQTRVAEAVAEAAILRTADVVVRTVSPMLAMFVSVVALAWLFGAVAMVARLVVAYLQIGALRKTAVAAGVDDQRLCRELSKRLGVAPPEMLRTPLVASPCLAGILRPAILLPEEMDDRLDAALVHELAHLRRWDCAWNFARRMGTAVLFFQPLMWRLSRLLETTAEEVCDDYVVGYGADRQTYADLLVQLAESALVPASSAVVPLVTLRSLLAHRVVRILDHTRRVSLTISVTALCAILTLGLAVTLAASLFARSELGAVTDVADPLPANDGRDSATIGATVGATVEAPVEAAGQDAPQVQVESSVHAEPIQLGTAPSSKPAVDGSAAQDDVTLHYRGRVVDPDGSAVGGAKVFFVYWLLGAEPDASQQPRAITDAQGWFDFTTKRSDFESDDMDQWGLPDIVATADGYGFVRGLSIDCETTGEAFKRLSQESMKSLAERKPKVDQTLHLVRDDVPLTGQMVSIEGKPIVGARLRVHDLWFNDEQSLDTWETAAREAKADFYSVRRTTPHAMNGFQLPSVIADVTTDSEGRFIVRGIGRERVVEFLISGSGIESNLVKARTRVGAKIEVPHQWNQNPTLRQETFHGATFVHVAGPSRPLTGRVTDVDSGQPLAGVKISAGQRGMFTGSGMPYIAALSGADGRYSLEGLPIGLGQDGRKHNVYALPPTGAPYLPSGTAMTIDLNKPATHDYPLKRGVWIRGQVVDSRTGSPTPGRIQYYAFSNNPHLDSYQGFSRAGISHETSVDPQGRFEIIVLPGPGIIAFTARQHERFRRGLGAETITGTREGSHGNMKQFRTVPTLLFADNEHLLRQIEPAVGSEPVELTLALASGVDVVGRIVDPDGEPLAGTLVSGTSYGGGWYVPQEGDAFRIKGYYADRPINLFFHHPQRDLAGQLRLEGEPPRELTVKLVPAGTIRGRLVDERGDAIAGVRLFGEGVPGENYGNAALRVATDEEGRFQLRGLVPGREYNVFASGDRIYGRVLADASVESSQTKDVGDVKLLPPEDPKLSISPAPAVPPPQPAKPVVEQTATRDSDARKAKITGTFRSASSIPAPPEPEGDLLVVEGRVVDPQGQPKVGADVLVVRSFWNYRGKKEPLARTTTDEAGRFHIEYRKSQYADFMSGQQWRSAAIAAIVPGFGPGWVRYNEIPRGEEITLRLVADEPLEGRIVNLEGKAVAGAQVDVVWLQTNDREDLSEWLDTRRRGVEANQAAGVAGQASRIRQLPTEVDELKRIASTGADGRFRLAGLGRGRLARLRVSGPGIALAEFFAVVRPMQPIVVDAGNNVRSAYKETYFGSPFQYAAEPSQPIEGVVRDAKTGQPIGGVRVMSDRFARQLVSGVHLLETISDAEGRYRLDGMPKGDDNAICVLPELDQAYFICIVDVPTAVGLAPIKLDLALHRGIWISGHITAKETGLAVPASLYYVPWPDNAHALDLPEFKNHNPIWMQGRNQSDSDGHYRIVGLPGRGLVEAMCGQSDVPYPHGQGLREIKDLPSRKALEKVAGIFAPIKDVWPTAVKEVRPADADQEITVDIALESGKRLPLILVDGEHKPVLGATIRGLWPKGQHREEQNAGPAVEVTALWSDEKRLVIVHHDERKLGKAVRVTPNDDGQPVTVQLVPCATVTGRLLDKNGEPVRGADIRFDIVGENDFGLHLYSQTTDEQGRFTHSMVPSGCEYAVFCESQQVQFQTVAKNLTVEPGEQLDLGEFDVTAKDRPKPIRTRLATVSPQQAQAPAVKFETNATASTKTSAAPPRMVVVGTVTTPDGKPAAGARVWLVREFTADISWNKTQRVLGQQQADAIGKFRFDVSADNVPFATAETFLASNLVVIAAVPGLGPGWTGVSSKSQEVLNVKLARSTVPTRGRILDLEGRPLAGVRLRVLEVRESSRDLDAWIEKAKNNPREVEGDVNKKQGSRNGQPGVYFPAMETTSAIPEDLAAPRITDAQGRVDLSGWGDDRLLVLEIQRQGVAKTWVNVITHPMAPVAIPMNDPRNFANSYFGADFQLTLDPQQVITGTATDADSGAPIVGAEVRLQQFAGNTLSADGFLRTTTDAQGKYALHGLPKPKPGGRGHRLRVMPSADSPYFRTEFRPPVKDGLDPVTADVKLRRAVWITGRVTDRATGEPIRGMVSYYPFLANDQAAKYQNFVSGLNSMGYDGWYATGEDGSYRIPGIAGRGVVTFRTDDEMYPIADGADSIADLKTESGEDKFKLYSFKLNLYHFKFPSLTNALREVEPTAGQEELVCNVALAQYRGYSIRFVDSDKQPLSAVQARRLSPAIPGRPRHDSWPDSNPIGPHATLRGFEQESTLPVIAIDTQRHLGIVRDFRKADFDAGNVVDVMLEPCATVTGRLVDSAGKPVVNVQVAATWDPFDGQERHVWHKWQHHMHAKSPTDLEGRFTMGDLPPGARYKLTTNVDGLVANVAEGLVSVKLGTTDTLAAGSTVDLGDIEVKAESPDEAGKAASSNKPDKNETVAATLTDKPGRVVDSPAPRTISRRVVADGGGPPLAGVKLIAWTPPSRVQANNGGKYEEVGRSIVEGTFCVSVPPPGETRSG